MALPKRYDMSMALQASIFASDAKANLFNHSSGHPQLFYILKHVASIMQRLLHSLLLHEKEDDEQMDGRPRALQ